MKRIRSVMLFLVLVLALSAGALGGVRLIRSAGQKTIRIDNRVSEKKKKNKKKKNNKNKTTANTGSTSETNTGTANDQKTDTAAGTQDSAGKEDAATVVEDGEYTEKDDVAAYIHEFGHLPSNFITKKEAQALGWDSRAGNLDEVAPGKSIGGDYFGNYEGKLPEKKGRTYHECDIGYEGGYRSDERIIYSDDGLVYYTEDHYNTFEQLY